MVHDDDAEDPQTMDAAQLLPLLARRLRHQRSQELEQFGLTPSQARAFAVINRALDHGQELRLSTLAERLRIAPRSATEVVDALQDKDLIRRTPSPGDRRAVAVEVTPAGQSSATRCAGCWAPPARPGPTTCSRRWTTRSASASPCCCAGSSRPPRRTSLGGR